MGSVKRKSVTNVLEVPKDILTQMFSKGFWVNREETPVCIEVFVGNGLDFDDQNALIVDNVIDETKSSFFTQMVDSTILIDGRKLSLLKRYKTYKIQRNCDGLILNIIPFEDFERCDDVIMTDYGYVSVQAKSSREATPELPNFYKK